MPELFLRGVLDREDWIETPAGKLKAHDFWLPRFVVEVFLLSWAILRGIGNASIE